MTQAALSPHSSASSGNNVAHKEMAAAISTLAMDAVQRANSGHPGAPMGMADIATVLFTQFLKYDPEHPEWPDRDRFILSNGHGSMLLYALLYLSGYQDMTIEEIKNFRQWGAKTAGHPEYGHAAGIETTTGPLGQGLANAVGMALAERLQHARYGDELVDHHTYAFVGDGCLMEGISQEAISLAGHLKLSKLILLFDDNEISIDGATSLTLSDDQCKRLAASGWDTQQIDGHDPQAIAAAIAKAKTTNTPSFIACKTTIAKGAPTKAGTSASHGAPLGDEEIAGARKALGWDHPPFEIPDNILHAWRRAGSRNTDEYAAWTKRLDNANTTIKNNFERAISSNLPEAWLKEAEAFKQKLATTQPKEATRKSSGRSLEILTESIPELIGGSADLTGSNLTKTGATEPINSADFSGRYIYYGVREHAMAAAMNGLALHGGIIPYGATFMVFTDYCRPSIRLSALMKQRVIYVMTHDSIGLGEDGPTHQPVEHLAALRAIPNLHLFRPCDATETLECWQLAVTSGETPSVLSLTRQSVPHLRQEYTKENLCARGGYVISDAKGQTDITLIGTGSEVHLCIEAQTALQEKGISAHVVSLPCWELFAAQPESYRKEVLGESTLKIAVEAASGFGWERFIGTDGIFIGMQSFGASAPAPELYEKFGITTDNIVQTVMANIT